MDEQLLLKKAQRGDDEAFYQLIENMKEQLYRIALSYLKSEEEALEAVQEVIYRAYINIKKLKKPEFFKTWITRIMINYCIDELKYKKRFTNENFEVEKSSESLPSNSNYDFVEIETLLSNLEKRYRTVIVLKYFHDYKISEIALILNKPEGTIKTWLYKGLEILKNLYRGSKS
jgi:RNA polymerase sigma-70 factor (ECF subfamily)